MYVLGLFVFLMLNQLHLYSIASINPTKMLLNIIRGKKKVLEYGKYVCTLYVQVLVLPR